MTGTLHPLGLLRVPPASEPASSIPQARQLPPPASALVEVRNGGLCIPPAKKPERYSLSTPIPRCSEKGCVFPANQPESSKCRQHDRQYREPALFRSHQPSMLLLDRAKFGVASEGEETPRPDDKRRLSKLWQSFLEGAA